MELGISGHFPGLTTTKKTFIIPVTCLYTSAKWHIRSQNLLYANEFLKRETKRLICHVTVINISMILLPIIKR